MTRIAVLLAALALLSCARSPRPAPRLPTDAAPRPALPPSDGKPITRPLVAARGVIVVLVPSTALVDASNSVECRISERELLEEELRRYITDFLSPIKRSKQYRRRYPAALKYIPVILDLVEADMELHFPEHDPLDPLLIGVIIAYESSWDYEVIGKLGEVGYMQVHGQIAMGGFEAEALANPHNQLSAGILHWRRAVNSCPGDLRGALTMYQTGKRCRPYVGSVKWRWRSYQKALQLFRFGKEKTHDEIRFTPCDGVVAGDVR